MQLMGKLVLTDILERRLKAVYGYDYVVLVGRARAGLLALAEVLGLAGREAVIPSNLCPAVPAALDAAGVAMRLASVQPAAGLADDDSLIRSMSASPREGLVMPTHLYGHWRPYSEAQEWARRHSWFVLENDTLCSARVRSGKRHAFGDALLVSFGYAKSINAGGGGALLTDDAELAQNLRKLVARWPILEASDLAAENSLMLVRRHLRLLGRQVLGEQLLEVEQAHLRNSFPPELAPKVLEELDSLEVRLAKRAEVAVHWERALEPIVNVVRTVPALVTAPWRLIRMVPEPGLRDRMVARLRNEGIDVGTNFPALTETFPALLGQQVSEGANAWSASVLNLWLDESYTPERIKQAVVCLTRTLEESCDLRVAS